MPGDSGQVMVVLDMEGNLEGLAARNVSVRQDLVRARRVV